MTNAEEVKGHSETFFSSIKSLDGFLDSISDLIKIGGDSNQLYQLSTSTDSTSSADFNYGGSNGMALFDSNSICAKCYAANFSTAEETFPPKLINNKAFLRNQFVVTNQTGDVLTLIFATHHAEQKYTPREYLREVSVELRAPAFSTIDLVLSNNLDDYVNEDGDKIYQTWYVRVYNNIKVRRIISHGQVTSHPVAVNFYYDGAVMPEIIYMCNTSSSCPYPSVTSTAFDFESGGKLLIDYLKRVSLINDYTSYVSCTTAKSFQTRDTTTGACYYEVQKVAALFIIGTYAIVGFCLMGGIYCVILFVISACWLCKKDFQDPEFL